MLFADLLSLHLVTFLMFFILVQFAVMQSIFIKANSLLANVTHNGFITRKTHVIVAEENSHVIIVSSYSYMAFENSDDIRSCGKQHLRARE